MRVNEVFQSAFKYYQEGNFQKAKHICTKILEEHPNNTDILYLLGIVYAQLEEYDSAIQYIQKALQFNSNNTDACLSLGAIFHHKGMLDEAINYYQKVVAMNPNCDEAYINLGNAFQDKGLIEEALECYRRALRINPTNFETHNNIGFLLTKKMRTEEAIVHFQEAIRLNPSFLVEAHSNIYGIHLLHGNLQEAWKEIEWRNTLKEYHNPGFRQRRWDGADVSQRTILIYNEREDRGYGDTIQFVRYLPLVAQRGAKILIHCQKELLSLLKNVEGVAEVIADSERPPHFDVHCNFLSLPFIFNTTLDTIPAKIPYITVNPLLVHAWKKKVRKNTSQFRIGIVWSSDPKHSRFNNRSFSIESFSPLACLKDIIFYSLQKGEASQQAINNPKDMNFVDLTEEITDFSDTAALIENLDLIISTDTAVAHLAGAVGKPVWTLLPFAHDGRWMQNRDDSPWYPTMRLFRQPSPGDWESVIAAVKVELMKLIECRSVD